MLRIAKLLSLQICNILGAIPKDESIFILESLHLNPKPIGALNNSSDDNIMDEWTISGV